MQPTRSYDQRNKGHFQSGDLDQVNTLDAVAMFVDQVGQLCFESVL
jgi:hypothetical protein